MTGNEEYLYRAKAFACFLLDRAQNLISEGKMHGGDRPYSLFEGLGGMAYTCLDMVDPQMAKFPGYELWVVWYKMHIYISKKKKTLPPQERTK